MIFLDVTKIFSDVFCNPGGDFINLRHICIKWSTTRKVSVYLRRYSQRSHSPGSLETLFDDMRRHQVGMLNEGQFKTEKANPRNNT